MTLAEQPRIAQEERVALAPGAGGARGAGAIGLRGAGCAGFNIVASPAVPAARWSAACSRPASSAPMDWLFGMSRTGMLRCSTRPRPTVAFSMATRLMHALRELAGTPPSGAADRLHRVRVDVMRQREVWLREGDLWDAVRASFAIPGLFTPWVVHGRELVDGGLLAPLPIAATRLSDAHRLIAVDMHGWPERPPGMPAQQEHDAQAARHPLAKRAAAWLEHRFGTDGDDEVRAEADHATHRSPNCSRARSTRFRPRSPRAARARSAGLVIRIPRDACQFYEFWRAKELIEAGAWRRRRRWMRRGIDVFLPSPLVGEGPRAARRRGECETGIALPCFAREAVPLRAPALAHSARAFGHASRGSYGMPSPHKGEGKAARLRAGGASSPPAPHLRNPPQLSVLTP